MRASLVILLHYAHFLSQNNVVVFEYDEIHALFKIRDVDSELNYRKTWHNTGKQHCIIAV